MSRKTSVKTNDNNVQPIYITWLGMVIELIAPKSIYMVAGRATSKTEGFMAARSQNVIYDMPGSLQVLVSDTYVNAHKNIVSTLLRGWERLGWREGVHYITDKRPDYGKNFKKPYKPLQGSFNHTISVFNGTLLNMVSLDQPSGGAGNSYQHQYGDEARLLKFEKLKKLNPAIRGDYVHFGHSPYYMGKTFFTDMPNILDGDDEWILGMEQNMDVEKCKLALQAGVVLNEIRCELYNAVLDRDAIKEAKLRKSLERWMVRWVKTRKDLTFFYMVSSFVNADILTEGYFKESFESLGIEEFKSAILSLKVNVKQGEKFYPYLGDHHFFDDGTNNSYYEKFKLTEDWEESSLALRYVDHSLPLDAGIDFGDMISMVTGQERGNYIYALKEFYTLPPKSTKELVEGFLSFYKHHKRKVLNLYYDRSGNQYQKIKRDWAHELKETIENFGGTKTGWAVNLMSRNQATIYQEEEYNFARHLFGETSKSIPKVKIDRYNCKCLRSSLQLTKVLVKSDNKGSRSIHKDKSSEKLAMHLRPMYSTNFSDAFKYLVYRKSWVSKTTSRGSVNFGAPSFIN